MDFQEWLIKHPKTKKVISKYRPKTFYFSKHNARPLGEKEVQRAMYILYKCQRVKRDINEVWKKLRDFIYCLVSHQMKNLSEDQVKAITNFHLIRGEEWNSHEYESYHKRFNQERMKYPKIMSDDMEHCLCGVYISNNHYYAFSDDLKLIFVIGSVCSGRNNSLMRRCKECGEEAKRMPKQGEYANICNICRPKYSMLYRGVEPDLIGRCLDCRGWFERKFKKQPRCWNCYKQYKRKINLHQAFHIS